MHPEVFTGNFIQGCIHLNYKYLCCAFHVPDTVLSDKELYKA